MAITNKFNYQPFNRVEVNGKRRYATPDGSKVPSVTTVLDFTKSSEDKRALYEWRKRVGEKKAQAVTTEAANRGTRMHTFLENYVKNDVLGASGTNPYSIQSHNMAQKIVDHGLINCDEYWGTEVNLYFPEIYAGTTDLVGVHKGEQAILDFKQTNKPKKREWISDYFTQLVAYADAHNEVHNTNIQKGVIMMCSADCEYQEFILEGDEYKYYQELWWARLELYYISH